MLLSLFLASIVLPSHHLPFVRLVLYLEVSPAELDEQHERVSRGVLPPLQVDVFNSLSLEQQRLLVSLPLHWLIKDVFEDEQLVLV